MPGISLPPDVLQALRRRAFAENKSASRVAQDIFRRYFNRKRQRDKAKAQ